MHGTYSVKTNRPVYQNATISR
jgi:hypothetical protein